MSFSPTLLKAIAVLCGAAGFYWDVRRRRTSLSSIVKTPFFVFLDILATATVLAWFFWGLLEVVSTSSRTFASFLEIVFPLAMFLYLWGEGRRANQFQRPAGIVFGQALFLGGVAITLLRLMTGEHPFFGYGNIGAVILGGATIAWVVPKFLKKKEEHHILDRVAQQGEVLQPEYTPPTEECPHPDRWTMMDSMTTEVEVMNFLKQIVVTLKPNLIVETGTFLGVSTIKMAEALRENGFGKIITCEFDPVVFAKAKERIDGSGLGQWIEYRNQSSLEMEIPGTIDIFFSDSHLPIRGDEIRRFLPQINPNGLILMHDTSSHYKIAREAAFSLEKDGLISMVLLPTPRGLMMAQKVSGRK